jgi:hypothetical protein
MVEGTGFFGIDDMAFVQEVVIPELVGTKTVNKNARQTIRMVECTLFRKKLPEILISSHLTTTMLWPDSTCLARIEARRPRR